MKFSINFSDLEISTKTYEDAIKWKQAIPEATVKVDGEFRKTKLIEDNKLAYFDGRLDQWVKIIDDTK